MSVLERFVRVRRFRARAAAYSDLASESASDDVRERYLAIADHYNVLAETELRSDRLERKGRLEELRRERQTRAKAPRLKAAHREALEVAARAPEPVRLRVIEGQRRDPIATTAAFRNDSAAPGVLRKVV